LHLLPKELHESATATTLHDELLEFVDADTATHVVVSFEAVSKVATAVINGLLRARKRLLLRNGNLFLCTLSDGVREVFRVLKIEGTVFQIYSNGADAVESLR